MQIPNPIKGKVAVGLLALSIAGLGFIKGFEGTEYSAYLDSAKVPTICTGSTKGVFLGQQATPAECEYRLVQDTSYAGKAVARCTTAKLSQEQYDAVVSFTFNVGGGAYCRSTLVRKLNAGDCRGAGAEFLRWDYAAGKRLRGLTTRRKAESALFLRGCV